MPTRPLSARSVKESALRFLARRDHSREEIRRKLLDKGYAPEEIANVVSSLAEKGLLDDARFARQMAFALAREKLLGPEGILRKLLQKGIPAELIAESLRGLEGEFSVSARLRAAVEKKLRGRVLAKISLKEKGNLMAYLRRRGFSWEDIYQVLQEAGIRMEE